MPVSWRKSEEVTLWRYHILAVPLLSNSLSLSLSHATISTISYSKIIFIYTRIIGFYFSSGCIMYHIWYFLLCNIGRRCTEIRTPIYRIFWNRPDEMNWFIWEDLFRHYSPVGWDCRIHRLQKGKTSPTNVLTWH